MDKEIAADYSNVQEMARQLKLSESAYRRTMVLAGLTPDKDDWLRHIDRFLLALGTLLVLALLVIAQVAGAAWWLRQVALRWEAGA